MIKAPQLPDDVDALKALLTEQYERNSQLEVKVLTLQEQLNLAIARRYAASSEKISPDQFRLFDEAEVDDEIENDGILSLLNEDDDATTVVEHTRKKKTGRKPLPDSLVRVDVVHTLSDDERICEHDGNVLNEMGEVISEQLDIIPAKIQVIRHIRKKYACDCGQCIKTAPMPKQPIPTLHKCP